MGCDVAGYKESRYTEIRDEMQHMLKKVGWKKAIIDKSTPVLPISGWMGDNLIKKSENMGWWNGVDVESVDGSKVHVNTLLDCLENMVKPPKRDSSGTMRVPLSGVYKIKGSAMCSPAASSRARSPRVTRASSSRPTRSRPRAAARSSPSRCTTRTSTPPSRATTSG